MTNLCYQTSDCKHRILHNSQDNIKINILTKWCVHYLGIEHPVLMLAITIHPFANTLYSTINATFWLNQIMPFFKSVALCLMYIHFDKTLTLTDWRYSWHKNVFVQGRFTFVRHFGRSLHVLQATQGKQLTGFKEINQTIITKDYEYLQIKKTKWF